MSGKTPSSYASQILAARIAANFDEINKQLEDLANAEGVTVEELTRTWDGDNTGD
ncbi:hypothetical protein F7734_02120 [Scytonema sp. UIC 10036]|uniref:hypothetical protein n=1 Tax=Scytonema sp. UIC 10036 TaxID=2304196 RepID=UPI0012DA1310|nr:hypothetical protein [Scytonema sp. UIC 10036]MUG91347.1 hypothetical protein [Scytonema sp. UIC 10036]